MEPIKNGGPAFPFSHVVYSRGQASYEDSVYEDGMTLRDYFAAAALVGVLAKGYNQPPLETAEAVYEYADAMLKERAK